MPRSTTLPRALFALAVVALPLAKALQLERWPGDDGWRQVALVVLGVLAVGAVSRRRLEVLLWSHVALPRPTSAKVMFNPARVGRVLIGTAAVGCCGLSVVASVASDRNRTVGLAAAGLLVVVVLAFWETRRHFNARARGPGAEAPDRAVLWVVAPAVLLWTGLIVQHAVRGLPFDGPLADRSLLLPGAPGRALFTVLVIGVGEEYLFRGLLLVLAIRAKLETVGFVAISLSFGFWHLPDALGDGAPNVVLTVAAMTLVSQLVFIPLRLRCRSLAGPALLHTANNLGFRML